LYRYTRVCSAILAYDMMKPAFGYICGQERVALCEPVAKDDLFHLVEVSSLNFGAYSWIRSRYVSTYCPHTHLSCTVFSLYPSARHGERAGDLFYFGFYFVQQLFLKQIPNNQALIKLIFFKFKYVSWNWRASFVFGWEIYINIHVHKQRKWTQTSHNGH
jgi:hypothetical protein